MATSTGSATPYAGQPSNVGKYVNVTSTTTGLSLKSGAGALYGLTINTPTASGVITLYDNTAASGNVIATVTVPASPVPISLSYNVYFATGLFLTVATQNEDITISFQ